MPEKGKIEVLSTAVDRAYQTAQIIYNVFKLDPIMRGSPEPHNSPRLSGVGIEDLLSGFASSDSGVQNLGSLERSRRWDEAKKQDTYTEGCRKEDMPLRTWCEEGFDNTYNGQGVSLREFACRVGTVIKYALEGCCPEPYGSKQKQ